MSGAVWPRLYQNPFREIAMAEFLNKEADPQEKVSAKGALPTTPQKTVEWDNTTDLGTGALERASIAAQAQIPAATMADSFAAGVGNSIIATAVRKADSPQFNAEPGFDAKQFTVNDPNMKYYKPNGDEIEYLHDSVSPDDYNYRVEQMLEQRDRDRIMGENIIPGVAGSILGDAPMLVAPMAAGGVAGRVGFAVRTAIRAADVGSAVYASDQLGQSDAVVALVAGMAGLDQLFDVKRAMRAVKMVDDAVEVPVTARTDAAAGVTGYSKEVEATAPAPKGFDPDAPTTRAAKDVEAPAREPMESVRAKAFDNPVLVKPGQATRANISASSLVEHLRTSPHLPAGTRAILDSIEAAIPDIRVELSANTNQISRYTMRTNRITGETNDSIIMRASKNAKGKTWNTVGDALDALDDDTAKVAVHELIHAATARVLDSPEGAEHLARLNGLAQSIASRGNLPESLKYYAHSAHEMLAGLANSPEWVQYLAKTPAAGNVSALRKFGEYIMQALGIKSRGKALDEVLDTFEDVVNARVKRVGDTNFRSIALGEMSYYAPNAQGSQRMLDDMKQKFAANFALYDNIAQGNKDLADLLVSDGAAVGARKPSVVDYKRNLTLEMDAAASVVEDAVVSAMANRGVGFMDRFFQRPRFVQARRELEDKVARYLDDAYDAEVNGRPVMTPDSEIAPIVAAYQKSGWAGKWHDHMTAAGLVEDGKLVRSDYYYPRQYSYEKMRQAISNGRTLDDFRDLFRQAIRETYPSMDSETVQKVAREMTDGIYNGRSGAQGPMWKQIVNGLSNDQLAAAMKQAGIPDADITAFMTANARESGATSPARNLRQRSRFNMSKEYVVNGQPMRMADLLDTDLSRVMHGYTNRMSGRVGMAYAGVQDLKTFENMINEGKHSLADPAKWEASVNDTIDFLLGGVAGGANNQLPEILRAAGNLANATMLKNSALYQITDTALAMKEFGMARVLRSMKNQPWFKEGEVALRNPDMAARLDSILRGSLQKEMRFRWLSTYADDNLDLTRSSHWFNVSQNFGQAARHANGMSMVHRMQVNINSGIVMDEIKSMLNGDASAFKRLERYGLDRQVADQAIAANARNPGAMLPPDLQMQVEVVGSRMMDYVVQQVRTGETSHFAQFNPVGKLIVGYQSFALAATNKILRRELNDAGWIGLAHIAAYQFPMMLLMTQAKYAMDGKKDTDTSKWIADSVMGMSMLGGLTMIQPLFTGETPRHSLAATGYVANLLGLLQEVASGNLDAKGLSQRLPLIQEFAPTRAIINNFGDD
ncbi:internal virion protein with endolysin domain [Shigella phage Buco]|uniref:Internal core protein n=1 Tax=Shigella phage Buco TaxID=2530183 RepID=A0A482JJP4_9CAUD|nr:internal virion protein with endolysin domain [Shigella phage Buco]QBP32943.1 hypothetical protein HRP29_gp43 [Shigella phage Buco]